MRFSYTSGTRPLDGYTIKRGIGIGGFGEVYFALNDAGKEVALKKIQRNLDIELRGVRHCLNLKHVNLISLWDIRTSELGESWVVMEYVPGPSLRDVVEAHQQGMPEDQVKRWFVSTCSGVAYLHEHGIVHRDLKPGNIFHDEDERVIKIGDYGLSKFISHNKRSRQTESVGTFHYMAPEIGKGEYGKEIDIYAMGVILFEMLTGEIPFDGESTQEIIMKHLTMDADVSAIPSAFQRVIAKSLRKDPHKRYRSISEMVRDLPWPDIAGSPDAIVSKHSVGPIHLDPTPSFQTVSTAEHPGSPTSLNIDPDEAESRAKLPPVLVDGRDIEIVKHPDAGIRFGPLKDSSVWQPESEEIQFLDDRTPHSRFNHEPVKPIPIQIDPEGDTHPRLNSADLVQEGQSQKADPVVDVNSDVMQSATRSVDLPSASISGAIGSSMRRDDSSVQMSLKNESNASVLVSQVHAQNTSERFEPIANAQGSAISDLYRWWNNANFSMPARLGMLIALSIVVIQDSTRLLPVVVGSILVYLVYEVARKFYLDPSLRGGMAQEGTVGRQNEIMVRDWLASRPSTDRMTELVGSMLVGAVATIVLSLFGVAVYGFGNATMDMWAVFTWQTLVGIAAVWLILAMTKSWSLKRCDFRGSECWIRAASMVAAGLCIGILAFLSASSFEIDLVRVTTEDFSNKQTSHLAMNLMPKFPALALSCAVLFGLARFGGQVDPLRRTRLSAMYVIACFVVAALLSHVFNVTPTTLCVLGVVISIAVQLASPWMHPDEQLEICRSQE